MIEVSINQQQFHLSGTSKLAEILPLLNISQPDGIAIAVNDTVVPRSEWEKHALRSQDKIFVIRATQGG